MIDKPAVNLKLQLLKHSHTPYCVHMSSSHTITIQQTMPWYPVGLHHKLTNLPPFILAEIHIGILLSGTMSISFYLY